MAHIVKLVKGEEEGVSKNMKVFDDKDTATEYCKMVDEVLVIVNGAIENVADEWMVYREELELIYK